MAREAFSARTAENEALAAGVARVRSAVQMLDEAKAAVERAKKIVHPLSGTLTNAGFAHVQPIARARIPIVKCVSPEGVRCDLAINNTLATHNTHLLATYCGVCPLFRHLALLVKAWAKARGSPTPPPASSAHMAMSLPCCTFYRCDPRSA